MKKKHLSFDQGLSWRVRYNGVVWAMMIFLSVNTVGLFLTLDSAHAEASQTTLSINVDTGSLSIELTPSLDGSFGKSGDSNISVNTNNSTGYTMIISSGSSNGPPGSNGTIESIDTIISETDFRANTNYNNKRGYKPSQYVTSSNGVDTVVQNTNYLPEPSAEGDILAKTDGPNNTNDTYSLSIGARANYETPSGFYRRTYNLVVVANPTPINIDYDENTTDTVENMPSPNPQVVSLNEISAGQTTLSDAIPTATGKNFEGWCDVATTVNSTTGDYECSGNTYMPGKTLSLAQGANADIQLYAIWSVDTFPIVWSQMGACEFHGNTAANITGSECTKYHNGVYIDTGIPLYSQDNYLKDYEIHFTIDEYDPNTNTGNDGQQTFVSDKVPSSTTINGGTAPGLVVRKASNNINVNSKLGSTAGSKNVAAATTDEISVYRISNVIYYSVNKGPLVTVQDTTGYNQQFDLTTWFGGYPSTSGCTGSTSSPCTAVKRYIEATFSNMYIRLGKYDASKVHTVTFDGNGGTPATTSYLVYHGNTINSVPEVTNSGMIFVDWYTEQNGGEVVTKDWRPRGDETYWAHWAKSVEQAQITNTDLDIATNNPPETIEITNLAEIEPHTFISNDTSIATVDPNTGAVTGVGVGTTTITMTGERSGATRTINVSVREGLVTVTFDAGYGSAIDDITVSAGGTIDHIPISIWHGHTLEGWYTGANGTGTKLTTSLPITNETHAFIANWVETVYVCKIATSLHQETCGQSTGGCRNAGYAQNDVIRYGTIPNSTTLSPGFAYTCDINLDNEFNETNERFYYLGTNNNNASLIYYKNIDNVSTDYNSALAQLPDNNTWINSDFETQANNKVARLITVAEAQTACGGSASGLSNHTCDYLMEQTNFANTDQQDGIWAEKADNGSNGGRRINTTALSIDSVSAASDGSTNATRPVIEVPLRYIETYTPPITAHVVTFEPHNGQSATTATINSGSALGPGYPAEDPTYANHVFQGWFTQEIGGDKISRTTRPTADVTYHAQWKLNVRYAEIQNVDLTLSEGGQINIVVSNSADVEPYKFSSNNPGIATVDEDTGLITGISQGTTTIVMTGGQSNLTKELEVDVTAAPEHQVVVSFNSNGGSSVSPRLVAEGDPVGELPTPTRTNYKLFGWYTDDNTFYNEVTPATVVDTTTTFYAKWIEDTTSFPIIWSETNACTFDGTNNVSGEYCAATNKTKAYIDTGVQLFIENNYDKDFEVGFNIVDYVPANNAKQATFLNSKQENSSNNYPGFVFRRTDESTTDVQLTQKWKGNNGATTSFVASTTKSVRIARRKTTENGTQKTKIYYTINGGTETVFQDITSVTRLFFDTKVWFGAATVTSAGDTSQRPLTGTLTDMYIRLGTDTDYTINFDANGGSVSPTSKTITAGNPLGELPVPTPPNSSYAFDAWYDESVSPAVAVSASTVPTSGKTYVAHWVYASSLTPVSFDVSNAATRGYNTIVTGFQPQITQFNKDTTTVDSKGRPSINFSTWGVAKTTYLNALKSNFESNNCMLSPGEDSQIDWGGGRTVNCSKPDVYDTGMGEALNVYLYNTSSHSLESTALAYTQSSDGKIRNMIPGKTYYWEVASDSNKYGVVAATSVNNRRWLDVGTIWNVRDLGGLPVDTNGDGTIDGSVKYEKLVRGGRLNSAANNITLLTDLGIDKEYDLAGSGELSPPDVQFSSSGYVNDTAIHYNFDYGTSGYTSTRKALTDIMDDVINGNNVYFHCRVGADRTGTIAYLLEALLGVPNEYRYEDYEMTSIAGLNDRTRYYDQKSDTNYYKFLYMMGYTLDTDDVYTWYLKDTTDVNAASRVASFRAAML